jgi:acyl-CoA thioester hydrolase
MWHEVDAFGHMGVQYYQARFTESLAQLYALSGFPVADLLAEQRAVVAVEQRISYRRELRHLDMIIIRSAFTRLGGKSLALRHALFNGIDPDPCAVLDQTNVMFSLELRRSISVPDDLRALILPRVAGEEAFT